MAVEENEAAAHQRRMERMERMTAAANRATEVANAIAGPVYWTTLVVSLATVVLNAVSLVVAPEPRTAAELVVDVAVALFSAWHIVRGKRRKRERQSELSA